MNVTPPLLRRQPGMTLIELLAVITVISILMAALLPAIGSMRDSAELAKNAANLRTLAQACHAYAADNDGMMPIIQTNGNDRQLTSSERLFSNRPNLLRLLNENYPGGEGSGYLDSAEVFYGPFTPTLEQERKPGQLKPYSGQIGFTISYMWYSLPMGNNEIEPGLTNESLTNPAMLTMTPLLSDPTLPQTGGTGFNGPKVLVVRVDGSVASFERERFLERGSYDRIRVLAGMDR